MESHFVMENAREVAATEIFCHGLREHDVDTEVYSSYVVVLLQGADDCDIDSAVADAVEALSAVLEVMLYNHSPYSETILR